MPDEKTRFEPNRPPSSRTSSNRVADMFDRVDAPALGVRKVVTQAMHDLYGTKDVQNAITASYVWLADQLGHLTLGLGPTLLACWVIEAIGARFGLADTVVHLLMLAAALGIFAYWVSKERQDLADTRAQAGPAFPFDLSDIAWNVRTALLYFGIGGLLGLSAFLGGWVFVGALALSLWPAAAVAYWWLRRKLAFQQAGLPYLYRLANFKGLFERPEARDAVAAVSGMCDLRDKPVSFWHVLIARDPIVHREPRHRHLLLTGPLRSGKTSLAVGIGTEFAFVLGLARYLSAATLLELVVARPEPEARMDYDDGRVLWPWNEVALLIVDDLDAGVAVPAGPGQVSTVGRLVHPRDFVNAVRSAAGSNTPLARLGSQRSVWVVGDPGSEQEWREAIAELMAIDAGEILPIQLSAPPPSFAAPKPEAPGPGRKAVGDVPNVPPRPATPESVSPLP